MITRLERVVPAAPGKPERAGAAHSRRLARRVALSPHAWTPERAQEVVRTYARLAERWDEERGSYRLTPIKDAVARGGPWQRGLCVEIGSGTGLLTPVLSRVWAPVVCIDLSAEMLRRNRHRLRVRADAARLPVADGVAAAVVIGDGPLFATEVIRVLKHGGAVVWSNALGRSAPNYVATSVVLSALAAASEGSSWDAVVSEAGWGSWAVLRREHHPRAGRTVSQLA